ncbi:MAG TPA: HAD family hydrolase [Terriglobales bacterium]|nr:HAD family hydrolase [Terriglobales bacterium]
MSSRTNGADRWIEADAYLFDIDGTLLNSRDGVHYDAFHAALREVFEIETRIDEVPVHGSTDPGILRAVLAHAGRADDGAGELARALEVMCAEVERNASGLAPQVCDGVADLLSLLASRGKLLGVASGNLERIGWLKLEAGGLRPFFAFGSFSDRNEKREDIFRAGIAEARRRLGRDDADIVIVGDTPADIRAARATHTPIIALATGVYSAAQLAEHGPDACFDCCAELLAAV